VCDLIARSDLGGDQRRWHDLSAAGMYWATSVAASNLRKLRSARAEQRLQSTVQALRPGSVDSPVSLV